MATRITEPSDVNPATTDWQNLLNKLVAVTGGFYLMNFTPHTELPPKVKTGSRFEINASYFVVTADEEIIGYDALPDGSSAYIYAIPDQAGVGVAQTATFEYSANAPVFDIALGGMFDGVNRCVGKIDKVSATEYTTWGMDTIHSQNVAVTAKWLVPTPALP
jgi:hypothetical protein